MSGAAGGEAVAAHQRPFMSGAAGRLVLHRLLTRGVRPTAAARIHGWARVLDREERGGRDMLERARTRPARARRLAERSVERFGAEVREVHGVPLDVQRRQIAALAVRYGLDGQSYLDFQLYRPERYARANAYLMERPFMRVAEWVKHQLHGLDDYPVQDKHGFERWCRTYGLACVPTLLEVDDGVVVAGSLRGAPAELPATDLFTKPSGGTGGYGTARWRFAGEDDGARRWLDPDGRPTTAEGVLAAVAHTSRTLPPRQGVTSRSILVQPALSNHRALRTLTPGALCTVRILVTRPPGGAARVAAATYKLATGDAPADNFHYGGILAPVDLTSGRLGGGLRRLQRVLTGCERHPDTGAAIAGHVLPYWPEALDLARRGLDAAPRRPSFGFDVAITDDGPVLIEGNTASNPDITQAPSGAPLSDTPFAADYEAHVRALMVSR